MGREELGECPNSNSVCMRTTQDVFPAPSSTPHFTDVQTQTERNRGLALLAQQMRAMLMKKILVTLRSWDLLLLQVKHLIQSP